MAESLESEEKEFDLYDDLIDPFFSLQKEEDNVWRIILCLICKSGAIDICAGGCKRARDSSARSSGRAPSITDISGYDRGSLGRVMTSLSFSQNRQLSTTNGALKKNISCLFKTATMEVERKNAEITSLKKQ